MSFPSFCTVGMHVVNKDDLVKDGVKRSYCFECEHNYIAVPDYGFGKDHDPRSTEIFNFIEKADYQNGDGFCFKHGGDGDNGEMLMDLLDAYFKHKVAKVENKDFRYLNPSDEDSV